MKAVDNVIQFACRVIVSACFVLLMPVALLVALAFDGVEQGVRGLIEIYTEVFSRMWGMG